MSSQTVAIVSDIHYAGEAEQAGYQRRPQTVKNPFARLAIRSFRDYVWLRNPTGQNHLLHQFFNRAPQTDLVIANGDFSCDIHCVGLSDDASFASARLCLDQLRHRFGDRLHLTIGDHELGKVSMVGARGGPRLQSWQRATAELALKPFWQVEAGRYILMGVTSTLGAWPVYHDEGLPEEVARWEELRRIHLAEIRAAFARLRPHQKVILFCHDPTALPYLYCEPAIRERVQQIERTVIGHLHSPTLLNLARMLSGMPRVNFLGAGVRRLSIALRQAKLWNAFRVTLCPSLAGTELLKDGGFLTLILSDNPAEPAQIQPHEIRR
ncbi:MAG: metallophosphoesterase [Opitutaceae bacterium]|nr:metallophosphoesterase [Verrucomicrobiales bacterium]